MKLFSFFVTGTTAIVVITIATLLAMPASVLADEIWLEPAKQDANSTWGNWGTARVGGLLSYGKETHFAFHVPDNFVAFTSAYVILIPPGTTTLEHTIRVNVAGATDPHYLNPATDLGSDPVMQGKLTEIDVTGTINDAKSPLESSDYVTVNFELRGFYEKTRVVGMRFVYVGAGGPQGPQGKEGPQGPQGKLGPQGPQGKLGPQGPQGKLGPEGPAGPIGPSGVISFPTNNTRGGEGALANESGTSDTAYGKNALNANTTGINNTAIGTSALLKNTEGSWNTATGFAALRDNTGNSNTAYGVRTLEANTTGRVNTATGADALMANTTGRGNTATGENALRKNTEAWHNTATGRGALQENTTGEDNTATGRLALGDNTTGDRNIALGFEAGLLQTTGSDNIYIGNGGGGAGESNHIYLGNSTDHTTTHIAGIRGVTTGVLDAIAVVIDSAGQLGTISSSRRGKEDIHDMGPASERLLALRPVTFRYKQASADGTKPRQYGLIAEEVAEVYPDLVVYGQDGHIQTVQYHKLVPLLLNEWQREHAKNLQQTNTITQQAKAIDRQAQQIDSQAKQLRDLKAQLTVVETQNRELQKVMARVAKLERQATDPTGEIVHTSHQE